MPRMTSVWQGEGRAREGGARKTAVLSDRLQDAGRAVCFVALSGWQSTVPRKKSDLLNWCRSHEATITQHRSDTLNRARLCYHRQNKHCHSSTVAPLRAYLFNLCFMLQGHFVAQ